MVEEVIVPSLFDFVPLTVENLSDLPASKMPYYVPAKEGTYVRKETALGPCIIPQDTFPHLKSMGKYEGGYFHFTAPRVSKEVMAQAFKFFKEVYKRHGTEAEVLLLLDEETKEYSIFLPYQVVSSVSVVSIFDQTQVPEHLTVVGTIHSHCDFSATHSGTDENDASDFNGLHLVIGHVDTNKPSFDAMFMNNKLKFTFNITDVADTSDLYSSNFQETWFDFFLKDAKEIYKKNLPGLTDEELDQFVKNANPPAPKAQKPGGVWMNAVKDKLIQDNYENAWWWKDNTTNDYTTRWSDQFKKSVNRDWFVNPSYGSPLTKEGFMKCLEEKMEELFDMAKEYDIFLEYDFIESAEEELPVLLTKGS